MQTEVEDAATPAGSSSPSIGFKAIPIGTGDSVVVPEGYRVQAFIPWGTPISGWEGVTVRG
jgi:secreted PhoX family phosphatase